MKINSRLSYALRILSVVTLVVSVLLCVDLLSVVQVRADEIIKLHGTIDSKTGSLDDETLNTVADELRTRLKKREAMVEFDVITDVLPDDANKIARDIYNKTFAHNGVPDEGDYLRWNIEAEGIAADAISDDEGNHVRLIYWIDFFTTNDL